MVTKHPVTNNHEDVPGLLQKSADKCLRNSKEPLAHVPSDSCRGYIAPLPSNNEKAFQPGIILKLYFTFK